MTCIGVFLMSSSHTTVAILLVLKNRFVVLLAIAAAHLL